MGHLELVCLRRVGQRGGPIQHAIGLLLGKLMIA